MDNDIAKKDHFALPSPAVLHEIARRQDEASQRVRQKRAEAGAVSPDERTNAAEIIQRNYRGYRARRALKGHDLDPSTRWVEALKDAKYHTATRPISRAEHLSKSPTASGRIKDRWLRAGAVAYRAGSDDTSDSDSQDEDGVPAEVRSQRHARKRKEKAEREKYAQTMGLEYFLEMVDHKHRYGSSLRRYHQEWKKADTRENFFYWLDEGDGKALDLEDRPRKRLETEQVRYLSRDARRQYLVQIDAQGRFCWAKNSLPITTSLDFKDSVDGIVPSADDTPTWREVTTGEKELPPPPSDNSSNDSSSIAISTGAQEDGTKYTNDELHDAKGLSKLSHLSVDALMNHLLRKTTKQNTWIFVADTSFRLYIGIKQSGAFQHSSFLHGARISAAGLITIKRGQIRKLSPLSGHYAPPVRNFRQFIKTLRENGADLSRLNISRSYAVILGLEGYIQVKKKAKGAGRGVKDFLNPNEKKRRDEESKDKSKSAQREREILEEEERLKRTQSMGHRVMRKLKIGDDEGEEEDDGDVKVGEAFGEGPKNHEPRRRSALHERNKGSGPRGALAENGGHDGAATRKDSSNFPKTALSTSETKVEHSVSTPT